MNSVTASVIASVTASVIAVKKHSSAQFPSSSFCCCLFVVLFVYNTAALLRVNTIPLGMFVLFFVCFKAEGRSECGGRLKESPDELFQR